ncbi:MAG: ACT domain-containing protein [Nanoarchaeota archaeon]
MSGIKKLDILLKSMKPERIKGEFVFCTISKENFSKIKIAPLLIFHEKEGVTIIVEKELADKMNFQYQNTWAMITLSVHSDLAAIGFLAVITKKLAEEGISVNAVSAYYHDHLFVAYEKAERAMKALKDIPR